MLSSSYSHDNGLSVVAERMGAAAQAYFILNPVPASCPVITSFSEKVAQEAVSINFGRTQR